MLSLHVRRLPRLALSALLLLAASLPLASAGQAQPADDPRYFAPTSYRIANDAFYDFFQKRGGIRTFGYPVSRDFLFQGCTTQFFQRVIMQRCGTGGVQTLNLLDPGLMPYTRINQSVFPAADPAVVGASPSPSDPDYSDKIIQFTAETAPDTWEGEPVNFYQTFLSTVRLEDAFPEGNGDPNLLPLLNLELWGAPTSRPQRDPGNANFIYQRFQRGIMHYDKTAGVTQGLLLADYLKAILTGRDLPPDLDAQARTSRFYKQYAPGQPGWLARPADLPATDLTNAFEPQQPGEGGTTGGVVPQPASGFAYGFQAHMLYFSQDGKRDMVNLVKGAGFNWLKHQVEWSAYETAPGQYALDELDAIVNTASSQGINVLLSVQHAPPFYRGPGTGLMPADPATYGQFVRMLAARYQGKVQAYELWNEQNLAREAGEGNVNPATFLPLLRAGYEGVKAGDPNALAMLGATSPTGANIPGQSMDDVEYLRQLYALNGGEARSYFDAVGAHPSGFSNPPDCTPATPECSLSGGFNNHPSFFAFSRIAEYYDVMQANGDGGKKIWFTEFGYDSTDAPPPGYEYGRYISEQQQADFLVRAFQKARALDYVGGMIVWNLNYQLVVDKPDEKWGFGVIRRDYSPRPAYLALQAMRKG